MSNKAIKELQPIFRTLKKAEGILGKEMREKITRKLISGAMAEEERDYIQGLRRDAAAKGLGKTREEHEKSL